MSVPVSIVVIAFNMERELPRTLLSLSPTMQRHVDGSEYEIIVVDNGSDRPVRLENDSFARVVHMENPTQSPAHAVNRGLGCASGELVGVMIDGARIASPGLIQSARLAARLHAKPIISTIGFHIGPKVQMESVVEGYDERREDELLAASGWEEDGYRLFCISSLAGSSSDGWFLPLAESNALFMRRDLWLELGGYDEAFTSPGGGLVNHDMYWRAHSLPDTQAVVLLGEGTFHQVHGGIATNSPVSPWKEFHREYLSIRGRSFSRPNIDPILVGAVNQHSLPFMEASARRAMEKRPVKVVEGG